MTILFAAARLANMALALTTKATRGQEFTAVIFRLVMLSAVNLRAAQAAELGASTPAPITARDLFEAMMQVPSYAPDLLTAARDARLLREVCATVATPKEALALEALMLEVRWVLASTPSAATSCVPPALAGPRSNVEN